MKHFAVIIFLFGLLHVTKCAAHELRPAYLEITYLSSGKWQVLWKQPIMGEVGIAIQPFISNHWLQDSTAVISYTETYLLKEWRISAAASALNNQLITIAGLEKTITDVLLHIQFADGRNINTLIKPGKSTYVVHENEKTAVPVGNYVQLGIEHILLGIDHLLFVLGLLLLVGTRKKLLLTITAFTVAHSITLALATLGLVHLQQPVVESIIALSIVFVGVELVKHFRGNDGFTYRYPWIVALVFGLLHGFGFAGALAEVGLPGHDIPLALLLFNIGVELGQLFFVGIILAMSWLFRNSTPAFNKNMRWAVAYGIGSVAVYWFVERLTNIF